jgi:hypothetical protein
MTTLTRDAAAVVLPGLKGMIFANPAKPAYATRIGFLSRWGDVEISPIS